jgi:GABA(A) receptor-associated protein
MNLFCKNLNKDELSKRISESKRIISKFPDRIPVIILTNNSKLQKMLTKNKFLVPYDLTVSYLLANIRNQMKLDSSNALFIFCDNTMLSGTEELSKIYGNYKSRNNIGSSSDNFLYISIEEENTFGKF